MANLNGDDDLKNAKKPVFLTKAQREQLALQRRQDQVAEQKRQLPPPPEQQHSDRDHNHSSRHRYERDRERDRDRGDRDRDRDRDRERERDRDRDRQRDRQRDEENKERERLREAKLAEREKEKELEAIKEQYLGSKKPKKRVIKPSEKFRFSFDWENTEDTSRDMNSLYQNPHEARLLFGRGFRAGMDRREQKKLAAKNEKEL